ncbi:NADPH:quinone reductase [Elioraea sp.]|uniref:NADPH:quinone reductase n=1 Tax=Elioraea sp. TaxID=2185103 RepID=UPI003F722C6F
MTEPTMRAAFWRTPGPAGAVLELGTMPRPLAKEGEVLVRIATSGVNPHDVKRRSGWMPVPPPSEPVVPHSDGAGVIEAVGPDVDPARIGERVWLFRGGSAVANRGTAAAFCVVKNHQAPRLPDGVPFTIGAALGVPALTAHAALFMDGPLAAGSTVLIQGGAGAVGACAVRFAARAPGVTVIATGSTPQKQAIAREAGAHHVVDYRAPDVAAQILALSGGVDRIVEVDFAANQATDIAVIKRHGVVASYSSTTNRTPVLDYYGFALKGCTLHFVQGMVLRGGLLATGIDATNRALAEGWLTPAIAAALPLDRIVEAHEFVEAGAGGKVVVVVDETLR